MGQFILTIVLMALAAVGGATYAAHAFTGEWSPMAVLDPPSPGDGDLPLAAPCFDPFEEAEEPVAPIGDAEDVAPPPSMQPIDG